jgi:lysophospholipase L1-like esterase
MTTYLLKTAVAAIGSVALSLALWPTTFAQSQGSTHWVGTWATAVVARSPYGAPAQGQAASAQQLPPQVPPAPEPVLNFKNQTLRQIVHISIGGERFRVVFSNAFGTAPLTIGAAHIAVREKDALITPNSGRPLTFDGSRGVVIPEGAVWVSDAVNLTVPDLADLAIDLYLPNDTAGSASPLTTHPASWQTNYVSPPGNHVGVVTMPVATTTEYRRPNDGLQASSWFFLSRVEVMAPESTPVIATLGDSITDGTQSIINTNNRWPDHLARRLAAQKSRVAVLNAGIGGNRVLSYGGSVSALARFERDVLALPGVTHVIVMDGINDIGAAGANSSPSAADLIAGHRQLITRAHAFGLKIYGATLTPFEGAFYWTPQGEAKRLALNEWIRTSKEYDAVLDFDAVTRDPNAPTKILQRFDPGDHLHPNVAGYQAMANSIDLSLFRPDGRRPSTPRPD